MLSVVGSLLALLCAASSLAQVVQTTKVYRVGFVSPTCPGPTENAFRQALRELGYVEGRNRRAARLVDKILKGAKPAELPVEQPVDVELAVNVRTAKSMQLTIPQVVLVRANKIVE